MVGESAASFSQMRSAHQGAFISIGAIIETSTISERLCLSCCLYVQGEVSKI